MLCKSEEHNEKVLLKLSSNIKFSQSLKAVKMIAVAPHHWFVQPYLAPYITFGVGYCFIHSKAMREARY
jgi:hypothetical protein